MSGWILGIDGGGTNSRVRVESADGRELYRGRGAGTNPNAAGFGRAVAAVRELVLGAIDGVGTEAGSCAAAYLGGAGVDRPAERESMAAALAGLLPGARVDAGNDAEAALAGALRSPEGYLLIAGTGSIALARSRDGGRCRAGGWGHWLGDEGSAFWLAFEAIKAGLRAHEGRGPATALGEAALEFFGLSGYDGLVGLIYSGFDKAAVARFAVKVEEARAGGDPVAAGLFDDAADGLAALAASVYDRFGDRIAEHRIALYGGLMDNNLFLRAALAGRLRGLRPGLEPVAPLGSAEEGACILARGLLEGRSHPYRLHSRAYAPILIR